MKTQFIDFNEKDIKRSKSGDYTPFIDYFLIICLLFKPESTVKYFITGEMGE
jgi:hypothetical protein